jgi:hypothetical protein
MLLFFSGKKDFLLLSFWLLGISFQSFAQSHTFIADSAYTDDGKRIYTTVRLQNEAPKIDGGLTDACWQTDGYWAGNYRQFMPKEGAIPSQKTEIKILYDDENVYVAIRAYDDEPEKIDRRIGRRDDFSGDIVGVCFDSYYDHRTGFEFDLTAAGSKLDLVLLNDSWDTNWNAVWHGKVGMEDSAWTAEMQIPLSQLRYGKKEEHVWGLHAWRWINRNQEENQWNLMPRDNPGFLYSIGELHGIRRISKSRKIELLPYTVGKLETYQKEEGNPYASGLDKILTLGLDGKVGISSDFTMDFTINPDFGQVEADPSVLNLTAFEVFLEEKRPFFLEGKNIFDFDFGEDLLFYSRRIGHNPIHSPDLDDGEYADNVENTTILGALKLTGKTQKGLSIGIMESLTAKEKVEITDSDGEKRKEVVEPLTNYLIGRVQKDINKSNTIIGGMFTATNRKLDQPYLDYLNRNALTGGLDFRTHWKNKTFYLDVETVFSHITGSEAAMEEMQYSSARYYQRPDADYLSVDSTCTSLSGHGGSIEIGKGANGKWRYSADLNWRSPGLELNDVGYLLVSDIISQGLSLAYVENEPKGIFRAYTLSADLSNNWNFGGQFINTSYGLSANSTFGNKWRFSGSVMHQGNALETRLLRGGPAVWLKGFWHNRYSISTDNSKKMAFRLGYHFHIFEDGISTTNDITPGLTYRMTDALELSADLEYSLRTDNLQYVDNIDCNNEERFIFGTLDRKTMGLTVRLDYAISPDLTIQYYGNPYISTGIYKDMKRITNPKAKDYDQLYHVFDDGEIHFDENENHYHVDEDGNGEIDYEIDNPDFNYHQFRSNLVARWEYKPGSTLFLVWTHGRSEYEEMTESSVSHGFNRLFDIPSQNVFLIKFSYWFEI